MHPSIETVMVQRVRWLTISPDGKINETNLLFFLSSVPFD